MLPTGVAFLWKDSYMATFRRYRGYLVVEGMYDMF
jgi:hypothetical protein